MTAPVWPPDDNSPLPPGDEARSRRMSRRAFAVAAGTAAVAGVGGWLVTRPTDHGIPWVLRRVLEMNEGLGRLLLSDRGLAPTFPVSASRVPKANGDHGLADATDRAGWMLRVRVGDGPERLLTLDEAFAGLPRVEQVTQFCCIEGWSEVVHWGGVRFRDFAARLEGASRFPYLALNTPDGGYPVGLDTASALHPQTLLCDRMAGEPLTPEHGGPVRLVCPVKYGIKNIKQLATLHFTDHRPADYWHQRGYDWFAGL